MVRVGVVADTHCPEFIDRVPDRVIEAFDGVSLILHAGDITAQSTIADLERVAPVEAVRGDHDASLAALPKSRVVTVEGKRIVLVHGDRSRWLEEPQTLLWTLSLGHFRPHGGLPRVLRKRFPDADAIVYGHTHRASSDTIDGVLVFNPGGVHQWNPLTARRRLGAGPGEVAPRKPAGWFEWCWLQVARHLRVYPPPTVGILEVSAAGVVPRIVPV
jgi:hypothetical protein